MEKETVEEAQLRYNKACHALQSGVAAMMNYDDTDLEPKHLRVGVNSAMVSDHALVTLLFRKGLITEQEFFTQLADSMEEEKGRYETLLRIATGGGSTKITLT